MAHEMVSIVEKTWVAQYAHEGDRRPQLGQIKGVYPDPCGDGLLLDVVLFAHDGRKRGRASPPMGGPRGFEPACAAERWTPIEAPDFEAMSALYFYGDALKPIGGSA